MKAKTPQINQKQQGSVLIVAVFLIVLVAGASAAITHMASSAVETTSIRMDSERAFYAAESARIMDNAGQFSLGDSGDLHADMISWGDEKNGISPGNVCPADITGSEPNLYRGWVGDGDWDGDNVRARHALCASEGNGGGFDTLPSDYTEIENDRKGKETLKGDHLLKQEFEIGGQVTVEGNLFVEAGSVGGKVTVDNDLCMIGGTLDGAPSNTAGLACIANEVTVNGKLKGNFERGPADEFGSTWCESNCNDASGSGSGSWDYANYN